MLGGTQAIGPSTEDGPGNISHLSFDAGIQVSGQHTTVGAVIDIGCTHGTVQATVRFAQTDINR